MLRFVDIVLAILSLLILSPLLLIISILIRAESKGNVIFRQERIGLLGKPFTLFKFRTMKQDLDSKVLLTVEKDPRITRIGKTIRKLKLDEMPQLVNVIKGEMSFVGPRPEVSRYVEKYSEEQKKILSIKPGITDLASIYFYNEGRLLKNQTDPEDYYLKVVIPRKIELNMKYINKQNIVVYFSIIFKTISRVFSTKDGN